MPFPDVVAALKGYLTPIVAPVAVTSRIPPDSTPRPPLLQIRRVGGPAITPVRDQARIDVFCWHTSDPEAMALALIVRAAIWALSGTTLLGPPVYDVSEFLGPRHDDDPTTGIPRVWATYQITVRADQAIQPAPTI